MKIVVCLKEVVDTAMDLGYGRVEDVQFQKGLSYRANPQDWLALAEALSLKEEDSGIEVTLISLGPPRVEQYLREGLSMGVDKAVRIWDVDFKSLSSFQKAWVLARAISLLKADLVLVGARSLDNSSGVTGPLIAAWLNIPGICEVVGFHQEVNDNTFTVTRSLGRGLAERLLVTLPAVLSIDASPAKLPYSSLGQIVKSAQAPVDFLKLADIGISPLELKKDGVESTAVSFPRPPTRPAPLDSSLQAYDRILALLEGGLSKRQGEVLKGTPDELADRLFDVLVKAGVIR